MAATDFPRFLEQPGELQTIIWTNANDNYIPTMKDTPHRDHHRPEEECRCPGWAFIWIPFQ